MVVFIGVRMVVGEVNVVAVGEESGLGLVLVLLGVIRVVDDVDVK